MKFFQKILLAVTRFIFSSISQSNAIVTNIENWAQTPAGQLEISWAEKVAGGIVGPATVKAIEVVGMVPFQAVGLIESLEGKQPDQVLTEVAATLAEIKAASTSAFALVTTDLSKEFHKIILGAQGAPTEVPNHSLLIESVYRTEKELVNEASVATAAVVSRAESSTFPDESGASAVTEVEKTI